jgi:molybdate transport system substrate-binding protein
VYNFLCASAGKSNFANEPVTVFAPLHGFWEIQMIKTATTALTFLLTIGTTHLCSAADIKLLSANALEAVMPGLLAQFEKSSGHKVTSEYRTAGAVADRVQKGEAVDVVIATGSQIAALQTQSKIIQNSRTDLVKVGIGVFVRRGASKPDISSADAFKRSLMATKFIAYIDPTSGGASGIYMAGLIERLGIAPEMKPKTKLALPGGRLYEMVARGEAEIGFTQISEVLVEQSVEFIGPLPAAIQNYTSFAAGIVTSSKQADAGKALIGFLSSPSAIGVMTANGFEPR